MDYTDIATLHAYGGFTKPTEEDDALLEHFISTASAMIDNFCGRVFAIATGAAATARTFTKDNGLLPGSGRTLWLEDDLCSMPTYAETGMPALTYIPTATPYNRIVRADGLWPDPTVVTGQWAYSLTPPAPIIQACLRLAKWLYNSKETTEGDRPIITPGGIVIMPSKLPQDIVAILASYRRVRLV